MNDKVDLVINGGTIVSPDARLRSQHRHQGRRDPRYRRAGGDAAGDADTRRHGPSYLLPGAIDVHVHFRDPGYPQKEDFASGTAAAAFGGVTTVFDMPNTLPTINNAEALADKHKIAAKAYVDYGLYAVLGEDSIEHVDALIDGGVIGFKLYMGNTFGRIPSPTTGAMLEAFEVVAPTGKRISLHAETNSIMERREARLRAGGRIERDRASGSTARRRRDRGHRPRADRSPNGPARACTSRTFHSAADSLFLLREAKRGASTLRPRPARSTCCCRRPITKSWAA
jgi:dihydroorotase